MSDPLIEKPERKLHHDPAYDFRVLKQYLKDKHGLDIYDVEGRMSGRRIREDKPYHNFWHWMVEHCDARQETYVTFSQEQLDEMDDEEEWVRRIYKLFLDEFADENGEVYMYVWW